MRVSSINIGSYKGQDPYTVIVMLRERNLTIREIADKIGKSKDYVMRRLKKKASISMGRPRKTSVHQDRITIKSFVSGEQAGLILNVRQMRCVTNILIY